MHIQPDQTDRFNAVARQQFLRDLRAKLDAYHTDLPSPEGDRIFDEGLRECRKLCIESGQGVDAYMSLSFWHGDPVSHEPEYDQAHFEILSRGRHPEELPEALARASRNPSFLIEEIEAVLDLWSEMCDNGNN